VTADSRDHPASQDQLSATVQEAQRGLGACASGHKFKIGQLVDYLAVCAPQASIMLRSYCQQKTY
jgi:hypothetical protein